MGYTEKGKQLFPLSNPPKGPIVKKSMSKSLFPHFDTY